MITKLRRILGLESNEERLCRLTEVSSSIDRLSIKIDDLADEFTSKNENFKQILKSNEVDEDFKKSVKEKYDNFIEIQKQELQHLIKERRELKSQHQALMADKEIFKAVSDLSFYKEVKEKYKTGTIRPEHFDTILKAKTGVVKYADNIVFNEEGKFLILQRDHNDNNGCKWVVPGGHVDAGEEFYEAAKRELQEEAGITVEDCTEIGSYKKEGVEIFYFKSKVDSQATPIVIQSKEIIDSKWITPSEIPNYEMPFNMAENLMNLLEVTEEETKIMKAVSLGNLSKQTLEQFLKSHKYIKKERNSNGGWNYLYKEIDKEGEEIKEKKYRRDTSIKEIEKIKKNIGNDFEIYSLMPALEQEFKESNKIFSNEKKEVFFEKIDVKKIKLENITFVQSHINKELLDQKTKNVSEDPIQVFKVKEKLYVYDGNHRAISAAIRGDNEINVRVYDLTEQVEKEDFKWNFKSQEDREKWDQISKNKDRIMKAIQVGSLSTELGMELIEKARSGIYENTPENKKLGRVGQKYGTKKEETKFERKQTEGKLNLGRSGKFIEKTKTNPKQTYKALKSWMDKEGVKFEVDFAVKTSSIYVMATSRTGTNLKIRLSNHSPAITDVESWKGLEVNASGGEIGFVSIDSSVGYKTQDIKNIFSIIDDSANKIQGKDIDVKDAYEMNSKDVVEKYLKEFGLEDDIYGINREIILSQYDSIKYRPDYKEYINSRPEVIEKKEKERKEVEEKSKKEKETFLKIDKYRASNGAIVMTGRTKDSSKWTSTIGHIQEYSGAENKEKRKELQKQAIKELEEKVKNGEFDKVEKSYSDFDLIKAFDLGQISEEILIKSRTGKYADTPENRRLKRVGQPYGSKKQETTSPDKEPLKKDERGGKQATDKPIEEHAKTASESSLQAASKGGDEELRIAAKKELDRREKEESVEQPEEKEEVKEKEEDSSKEDNKLDSLNETLKQEYKKVAQETMSMEDFTDGNFEKLVSQQQSISTYIQTINNINKENNVKKIEEVLYKSFKFDGSLKDFMGDGDILGSEIKEEGSKISISTVTEDGFTKRTFDKSSKTVDMELFLLSPLTEKGKGKGTSIFKNQVEQFKKIGFNKLETHAGDIGGMNGYYTWARLGYEINNSEDKEIFKEMLKHEKDNDIKKATSLQNLMETKKGQTWWRENGFGFKGTFDLKDNSTSLKTLNDYKNGKN